MKTFIAVTHHTPATHPLRSEIKLLLLAAPIVFIITVGIMQRQGREKIRGYSKISE
jgi:hypothetical protein